LPNRTPPSADSGDTPGVDCRRGVGGWHNYFSDDECDIPDAFGVSSVFASAPSIGWWLGTFDGHESNPSGVAECFGPSCSQPNGPYGVNTSGCGTNTAGGSQFHTAVGTASDMWVAGWQIPADDEGTILGPSSPLACHYANGTWTDASPPAQPLYDDGQYFTGATLLPHGELWAVGRRFSSDGQPPRTSIMQRATDGTWSDLGGINFEWNGAPESAYLDQIVHMPGTQTQMWATGFREPWPEGQGKPGRFGGFLLYHP
jgi:hypothetical protein